MRVTLEEIARATGVSKATVSRVLNDVPEGVGAATRERVKEALRRFGYVSGEQNVAMNIRSRCIGLIVPDITNPFFSEIAREVSAKAMSRDYMVILGDSGFSLNREDEAIRFMLSKKIDGMILVSAGSVCNETHELLEKYSVPCLLLDRDVVGMKRVATVVSDNVQISYTCCELLMNHGSFDIAYITGPTDVSTARERLEGYRKALERFNIPYREELIKIGNYTMDSGYNAVLELQRSGVRFSAVMAANDMMALGAMKALQELDYDIPKSAEIIGFDNIVFSQITDPPLTTVQQPTIEMGQIAVNTLIDAIDNKRVNSKTIKLKPRILKRKTTR